MAQKIDPALHEWTAHERVIVYDGVCNWCNVWVRFVTNRTPHGTFRLETLQSQPARLILRELQLSPDNFETFLLLERTQVFTKSTAALRIAKQLSGLWPLFYGFIVIPRPLRDAVYDFVALHRYKWMGKVDQLERPSERHEER
ncbi:MAG: Thiol-disulfide oxidoreductase DCC family protein [Nitrospira sp.]|nr:MAG: Thiol-disulfide oxidoreductase DCC family protein [Nitrospira sp.]